MIIKKETGKGHKMHLDSDKYKNDIRKSDKNGMESKKANAECEKCNHQTRKRERQEPL